jgi:hypothetical protein
MASCEWGCRPQSWEWPPNIAARLVRIVMRFAASTTGAGAASRLGACWETTTNLGSVGGTHLLASPSQLARQGWLYANLHPKLHRAKCRLKLTVLRRPMRFGIYVALAIAAVVGACATNSDTIDPIYVSPSTYEHLTCRQIGEEQKRITREEAANMQGGKATDAEQVGLLKGAMEALEQISIEKGCNIEFQHG